MIWYTRIAHWSGLLPNIATVLSTLFYWIGRNCKPIWHWQKLMSLSIGRKPFWTMSVLFLKWEMGITKWWSCLPHISLLFPHFHCSACLLHCFLAFLQTSICIWQTSVTHNDSKHFPYKAKDLDLLCPWVLFLVGGFL